MKTAISLPDELFGAAERAAARLGLTRSELFRRALVSFLQRNDDKLITEALDEIYVSGGADPGLHRAIGAIQARSIPPDEW